MKKTAIILLLLTGRLAPLTAQTDNKAAAIAALKKLTMVYQSAPFLSFDIAYYYSGEERPGIYLDSLKGNFKMSGNRYWYLLDSTETMVDTASVVILYKEDKIMYLSKPSSQTKDVNPLALLDSFLLADHTIQYSLVSTGGQQVITIRFAGNGVYKEMDYYVDAASGLLVKSRALVKAEQLYDPEIRSQVNAGNAYAVVETRFTHYRQNSFDAAVFNTRRYFKKEGSDFITTPSYSMYKIFLGKPGL